MFAFCFFSFCLRFANLPVRPSVAALFACNHKKNMTIQPKKKVMHDYSPFLVWLFICLVLPLCLYHSRKQNKVQMRSLTFTKWPAQPTVSLFQLDLYEIKYIAIHSLAVFCVLFLRMFSAEQLDILRLVRRPSEEGGEGWEKRTRNFLTREQENRRESHHFRRR